MYLFRRGSSFGCVASTSNMMAGAASSNMMMHSLVVLFVRVKCRVRR